ncbi:uncharacterized protein LOC114263203 [Camellia sinensis]|uniref:uncharacterized protein LOC114263203 n=1 Tax=Camellia sinensis TaxID=4442 RepID=UPI0010365ED3|nr:uncharacterized protein LOC114263203 [Camellia sinensis]
MTELNEFIENSEIQDLPLLGRKYTWCNSREGVKWSRIDRVLVDPKWLEGFQLKLWGLPRFILDHSPLLLMEDERDWGLKLFWFLNAWCLHPNLSSFVAKVWKETEPNGWAGFILHKKLKELKLALRQWNKEVYGSVPNKLKAVEEEVHILNLQAESRELDQQEKDRRRAASEEVWRLHRMMEWTWLQKSRLNWNLKGDRNTRFFHVMAKGRQCRNEITSMACGGSVLEDPCQMKSTIFEHFKK